MTAPGKAVKACLLTALLVAAVFPRPGLASPAVKTEQAACAALKRRLAHVLDQRRAGPASGWSCDVERNEAPGFYIMRLNSGLDCPTPIGCSSLLGWYAVRKRDGQVRIWDVANLTLGKPL